MARGGAAGILAITFLTGAGAPGIAPTVETPAADEVLDLLQVPTAERRRLVRGEIVSYSVNENSERELAVGLAMFVLEPASRLAEYLAGGQLIARDATISAYGIVPDQPGALSGPGFTAGEGDETERLLEAWRQGGT